MTGDFQNVHTGIDELDQLLEDGGIKCHKDRGLLGVILGPSGSGKSILGMQLCCSFLLKSSLAKRERAELLRAVYLSQEPPDVVEARIRDAFGYFRANFSELRGGGEPPLEIRRQGDLGSKQAKPSIYLVELPLDSGKQEAVLKDVLERVKPPAAPKHDKPAAQWEAPIVCIDNVEVIDRKSLAEVFFTLRRGKKFKDEFQGPASTEIMYRVIRESCSRNKTHIFCIVEDNSPEDEHGKAPDTAKRPEVYAADIAIHLGLRDYPIGYRERYLEIIKAKNQFYYRGAHHFSIVGARGERQTWPVPDKGVGINIYPSLSTQLSRLQSQRGQADAPKPPICFGIGIDSLDSKIRALLHLASGDGYIRCGSTSVLVSDLDIKATEIALHFGFAPLQTGRQETKLVYISFLHEEPDLRSLAKRFGLLENVDEKHFALRYFPPEYISEHKLIRDIDLLLQEKDSGESLIVVLDNVFELQCKYPMLSNWRHFTTALFELFRVRKATSLIVDTVEAGEARNPIEASLAAGLADNVFLLRHVEFQSKPFHVFSVLKLVHGPTPEYLWDLQEERRDGGRSDLVARETFDLYKNVLSGRPTPVSITFTFYIDEKNSPFHRYLEGQIQAIRQSFGKGSVNVNLYGPEEYSRVQSIVTLASPPQRSDCHIVVLDEFWLERLIEKGLLEEISPLIREIEEEDIGKGEGVKSKQSEYMKEGYVSAAHDLALFHRADEEKASWWDYHDKWYAIPARNNCGMLCCNPNLVREATCSAEGVSSDTKTRMNNWLDRRDNVFTWDDLIGVKHALSSVGVPPPVDRFFTFCMDQMESCVSFLIELILSYSKNDLVDRKRRSLSFERIPAIALQKLVELLEPADLSLLAAARFRRSENEPPALFSRQWMSTLGCLRTRMLKHNDMKRGSSALRDREYFRKLEVFELPRATHRDHPTPVSGTWYLGMLKNSVALKTGVRIIMQFTSVPDEIYKLNNYVGLPVRSSFYKGEQSNARGPFSLPYSKRYAKIAKRQTLLLRRPAEESGTGAEHDTKKIGEVYRELLYGNYPFYRMSIADYHYVAPVLWRLLIRTARAAIANKEPSLGLKDAQDLIQSACVEYKAIRSAKGWR